MPLWPTCEFKTLGTSEKSVQFSGGVFSFVVFRKLTKVLKNYVDNAEKLTEQLLKAMKALEYIFKFIVRSRVLFNQYVT